MKYREWNDKIAAHFFNPDKAGEPVLLAVERKIIKEIATQNDTTYADFIAAVRQGYESSYANQRDKICAMAHKTFTNSKNKNLTYPIYIGYLALFVLAVTHGDSDDFSANNYYGRLRDLLGEEKDTGAYPSYRKMLDLWDDLEKWSTKQRNGELGEFYCNIHGQHIHVGIPLYQVALTGEDVESLPKIFYDMGWDASSTPTDAEIEQALKENKNILSKRTAKRISSSAADFLHVLCNRFRDELLHYSDEGNGNDSEEAEKLHGQVVLCANIDKDNESLEFYFRCKRSAGLPSELVLEEKFTVIESNSNFSEKIEGINISWEKSKTFQTGDVYEFRYIGNKYKIFTHGEKFSLRGYISGEAFSKNEKFLLCIHDDLYRKTKEWGSDHCDEFKELSNYKEMPKKWHLFEVRGVKDDKNIKKDIPALAIDDNIRINLHGGIRLGRGNKFFVFDPPQIQVVSTDNVYIEMEDGTTIPMKQSTDYSSLFFLPEATPHNTWLTIKAGNNDEPAKMRLMLANTRLSKKYEYEKSRVDCFGNFDKSATSLETVVAEEYFPRAPAEDIRLSKKIYYLGNCMGEVSNTYPDDWSPAWVVNYLSRKKAEAIYLGNSDAARIKCYPDEKVKLWKKIIWHERKKITPPRANAGKQWQQLLMRAKGC